MFTRNLQCVWIATLRFGCLLFFFVAFHFMLFVSFRVEVKKNTTKNERRIKDDDVWSSSCSDGIFTGCFNPKHLVTHRVDKKLSSMTSSTHPPHKCYLKQVPTLEHHSNLLFWWRQCVVRQNIFLFSFSFSELSCCVSVRSTSGLGCFRLCCFYFFSFSCQRNTMCIDVGAILWWLFSSLNLSSFFFFEHTNDETNQEE